MKWLLALALLSTISLPVIPSLAAEEKAVVPFDQVGMIVDLPTLFAKVAKAAQQAGAVPAKVTQPVTAGRAFVTTQGVFAFLESPENQAILANIPSGSTIQLKGRLLTAGALLHADRVQLLKNSAPVDWKKYADESGTPAMLQGTNKCQCGLTVGELPHSCALGHLHHLEAADGKIYHYLQFGAGPSAHAGTGSHFKKLDVKARVFPGNYLLVQEVKLAP